MNYRVFLGIIEREYTNKVASMVLRASSTTFFSGKKEESNLKASIEAYKSWFQSFVVDTPLTGPQNETISAIAYLEYAALEREAIPPFSALHPKLVKALKLFTNEELNNVFRDDFVSKFEKVKLK